MKIQLNVSIVALMLLSQFSDTKSANIKNPQDLLDDARLQVQQLRSFVQATIFNSYSKVDALVLDLNYYLNDYVRQAKIDIQQKYQTCSEQLLSVKNLAQTAGADISVCLAGNEENLNALPQQHNDGLDKSTAFASREVQIIQEDVVYYMSILINEVEYLDFILGRCGSDFLCISPIIERVELAIVDIPLKVGVEIDKAGELAEDLKVLTKQSTDEAVAEMSSDGDIIIKIVVDCAEKIMS